MARIEPFKRESSSSRQVDCICGLLCNMWNHSFLHHPPNVAGFGVCLATAEILLTTAGSSPHTIDIRVSNPSAIRGLVECSRLCTCKWAAGWQTHPLCRVCEHGASLRVRNWDFSPAWDAHIRATFTQEAQGLQVPTGDCVCLLGAVSAVPLCKGNRLLVCSPTALQTQLCCGRFNTYLMRTMCVHTYGCLYICLHIHTI